MTKGHWVAIGSFVGLLANAFGNASSFKDPSFWVNVAMASLGLIAGLTSPKVNATPSDKDVARKS